MRRVNKSVFVEVTRIGGEAVLPVSGTLTLKTSAGRR